MKRLASILFVLLVILNTGGYYLYFAGLEIQHDLTQSRRLSEGQFSGSDAVIIKIPAPLPYGTNDSEYQNTQGKFLYDGHVYRVVKTRRTNDTLFAVCVKDKSGTSIRETMTELSKQFSDLAQTENKPTSKFNFLKDYVSGESNVVRGRSELTISLSRTSVTVNYSYKRVTGIAKPPQLS